METGKKQLIPAPVPPPGPVNAPSPPTAVPA